MMAHGISPWISKDDHAFDSFKKERLLNTDFFIDDGFWGKFYERNDVRTTQLLTELGYTKETWKAFWKNEGKECLDLISKISFNELSIEEIQKRVMELCDAFQIVSSLLNSSSFQT